MQRCAILALALTDAHMRQTTQQRYCICGDDRGDLSFGTPLIYPLLLNGLEPQMIDFLVVLSVRGDSSAELSLSLQVSLEMHTDGGLISWSHVHVFFARTMSSHRSDRVSQTPMQRLINSECQTHPCAAKLLMSGLNG